MNSESWVNLTKKNIEDLESIDQRIVEAPISTGIPGLYLELACVPLRFMIIGRRVMFLHYILNCYKSETISKVFWSQNKNPLQNDWTQIPLCLRTRRAVSIQRIVLRSRHTAMGFLPSIVGSHSMILECVLSVMGFITTIIYGVYPLLWSLWPP